jgi:hypothetical protein
MDEHERQAMLATHKKLLDEKYCPECQHPWDYHTEGGCAMPVTPGTHTPVTRNSGARERCNCTKTRG